MAVIPVEIVVCERPAGQAAAADVTAFEIREAAFLVTDGDERRRV